MVVRTLALGAACAALVGVSLVIPAEAGPKPNPGSAPYIVVDRLTSPISTTKWPYPVPGPDVRIVKIWGTFYGCTPGALYTFGGGSSFGPELPNFSLGQDDGDPCPSSRQLRVGVTVWEDPEVVGSLLEPGMKGTAFLSADLKCLEVDPCPRVTGTGRVQIPRDPAPERRWLVAYMDTVNDGAPYDPRLDTWIVKVVDDNGGRPNGLMDAGDTIVQNSSPTTCTAPFSPQKLPGSTKETVTSIEPYPLGQLQFNAPHPLSFIDEDGMDELINRTGSAPGTYWFHQSWGRAQVAGDVDGLSWPPDDLQDPSQLDLFCFGAGQDEFGAVLDVDFTPPMTP